MPYIKIKLVEGRSLDKKRRLVAEMTDAVCRALEIDPIHVRIELVELKADQFAIAGQLQMMKE